MLGYISWISYTGHINWSNDVELTTFHEPWRPTARNPSYRLRKVIHLGVKRRVSVLPHYVIVYT